MIGLKGEIARLGCGEITRVGLGEGLFPFGGFTVCVFLRTRTGEGLLTFGGFGRGGLYSRTRVGEGVRTLISGEITRLGGEGVLPFGGFGRGGTPSLLVPEGAAGSHPSD